MKILIIEDEARVTSFLKKGLLSEGFTVDCAYDGEEGLYMAQEWEYDIIILDVKLPKMDGISISKKLRSAGKTTPIIMLTAKDSVEDRIKGLDAGADDYLTKPFSFAELLARVRALTRRGAKSEKSKTKVGDLELDQDSFEAKRGNKKISLSATEFKLLKYLMQNKNKVLSKTMILENIWGYDFSPESNIVEVYMKYLRDKIDKGFKKSMIANIRGIGYKICN